jgi:hypothetical protein
MIIFIDESGIHKQIDHSTFVLVYIEIQNYDLICKELEKIESDLKIGKFHWSEISWRIKEKFLTEVLKLNFKPKVAVVKNPIKPYLELEKCLSYMIIEKEKEIECIFIDGKKPKWYERRIKKMLRDKNIKTRKLRTVKSEQCPGVRLADMVAGLARSYFDQKNPNRINKYYRKLEKKGLMVIKT